MPSRPLTFDHAAAGLAYALSKQTGGRAVALLVPGNWNLKASSLLAAVDLSRTHKSHSAVVNLIQAAKRRGRSTTNAAIYMTGRPTMADKGIFIEQAHKNTYLYFLDGDFYYVKPSHESRHGTVSPVGAPPRYEPPKNARASVAFSDPMCWWRNVRIVNDRNPPLTIRHRGENYQLGLTGNWARLKAILQVDMSEVEVVKTPLAGHVPRFALPIHVAGGSYPSLSATARRHFDSMFVYTALALVPARADLHPDAGVARDLPGHNVGAVLVSTRGKILSWGLNMGRINATLHAEVSVIKAFQASQSANAEMPAETRLYTSLEPCFMCSGQLYDYRGARGMTIIYVQTDPKFHPRPTFLTDAGFGTYTADDLGLVYRGRGVGWTARLTTTQTRLATQATPANQDIYASSAISVLNKEKSQSRRFAKAALDLAEIGHLIHNDQKRGALSLPDFRCLIESWAGAMRLVMIVSGHLPPADTITAEHVRAFLTGVGTLLDATQHKNQRRVLAEAGYRAKAVVPNKYTKRATDLVDKVLDSGIRG